MVSLPGPAGRREEAESDGEENAWKQKGRPKAAFLEIGAGEGIRTLDPNLGKVVLYP